MAVSRGPGGMITLEDGWSQIKCEGVDPFIALIQKGSNEFFNATKFVKLYDVIFRMSIQREPHNWSADLYQRYGRSIRNYLRNHILQDLFMARQQNDITYLQEWCNSWNKHDRIVKGLSKLFMYLDRYYTPHSNPRPLSLTQFGFSQYEELVFEEYCHQARAAILRSVSQERDMEQQDHELLSRSVAVFVELGKRREKKLTLYKAFLEQPFLDDTRVFYLRRSRTWLESDSCPAYLQKVEQALERESERVQNYFHPSTQRPVHEVVHTVLLGQHLLELLRKDTGLEHLISTNSMDHLRRLFDLVSRGDPDRPDLVPVAEIMCEYVSRAGTEYINQAQPTGQKQRGKPPSAAATGGVEHNLVEDLVNLHARMHRIVEECFQNATLFQKHLHRAFEQFINRDARVSRHLAKYVHILLKKGSRVNVEDKDVTLKNAVFLYGHIRDKDIFEHDYQTFLAERLLENKCESEHDEKKMIAMLKSQCGYQWANKLEGMFKDIQLSKDLMQQFRDSHSEVLRTSDLDLDVNICTQGFWPQPEEFQGRQRGGSGGRAGKKGLPEQLLGVGNRYTTFYLNQHSGRRLEWQMHQGTAECKVTFRPSVEKTLVVTSFQMLILLAFNERKVLTYPDLLQMTGIPDAQIPSHLLSLCHPKVGVLMKRPGGIELNEKCKFMINGKYSNPLLKIVVPLLKLGQPARAAEPPAAIQIQRRCMTDAAIVRIMKTRRELRHNLLVVEVIQQIQARFDIKPKFIKERIEHLMDEYIIRSPDDRSLYLYKL